MQHPESRLECREAKGHAYRSGEMEPGMVGLTNDEFASRKGGQFNSDSASTTSSVHFADKDIFGTKELQNRKSR